MSLMPIRMAADRDHDQHVDQVGEGEVGIEPDDLDRQRAAETGKPAADREGDGESALDIDAEPARHALVVDGGAHLGAEAGEFQPAHQRERDRGADQNQKQPIGRDVEPEYEERAAQEFRRADRLLGGAEEPGRRRHRDEGDADGEQHLVEVALAVETAVEDALEGDAQ